MVIFSADWGDRPVVHGYPLGHPPRPPPPPIKSKRNRRRPRSGFGARLGRRGLARPRPFLILFTESFGVSFAVRIEEFLAALLPSCSEVGRCDVPIRPAFLGYGAEVLTELLQGRPTEKPVAIVDLINDKAGLEDNHMRDHRIVEGIGIFGDIEILLHDTPRV
jgi:hypothetical protein